MPPSVSSFCAPFIPLSRRLMYSNLCTLGAWTHPPMARTQSQPQSLFFSRDESWLNFNRRVLEEAQDETNPLLERVKFLAITASNLDEFVEIRVAGVLQRIEDGYAELAPDGTTLEQSLAVMNAMMHGFVAEQYLCWNKQLLPALNAAGVCVLRWDEMDDTARKAAT